MRAVDTLAGFVSTSATQGHTFGLEQDEAGDLQHRQRGRLEVLVLRGWGLCFQSLPEGTLLQS